MQPRFLVAVALWVVLVAGPARAQFYAGFVGGVATLSGDARSLVGPSATEFSSYNATNGPVLNPLVGKHLNDFVSVQGEYLWNRNPLVLSAGAFTVGSTAAYQEERSSSQSSVFGSVLVYFRPRESRVRPYLSVGTGWVHFASTVKNLNIAQGAAPIPPNAFSADMIGLRVPVGIDLTLHRGWRFRYSFAETITRNPISHELDPAGPHSLKNFQNLFGIVREF
ncbi:MAG TPA: outer membrane beta-barrel protein [Candidatus Sulfotelmatobacter sp.]|nr:outer membrane beta-barrel protein [Candidatus Sulfotelmatobacter sp.]